MKKGGDEQLKQFRVMPVSKDEGWKEEDGANSRSHPLHRRLAF
jgi:hypothetical protein